MNSELASLSLFFHAIAKTALLTCLGPAIAAAIIFEKFGAGALRPDVSRDLIASLAEGDSNSPAGAESGGFPPVASAALDPFLHQEMRECPKCGQRELVFFVLEFSGGRVGFCTNCRHEHFELFTRTNSEVA